MLVCNPGSVHFRGKGSEKIYCLYTHENVDIFGWLLNRNVTYHIFDFLFKNIFLDIYQTCTKLFRVKVKIYYYVL